MKLFLSYKEADLIQKSLSYTYCMVMTPEQREMATAIQNRIDECFKLQVTQYNGGVKNDTDK